MNRKCEIIVTACISVSYAVKAVSKMNFFKLLEFINTKLYTS